MDDYEHERQRLHDQQMRNLHDARRWRFAVARGEFPSLHQQSYPDQKVLGWRTPSQNPPNGVLFNPDDYPYYDTAEAAIDAAIAAYDGRSTKP